MQIKNNGNIKIAVQKSGRLTEKSLDLLRLCGLRIENYTDRLSVSSSSFPIDILFLRDDDIPEYVQDGVADLGIIGENVLVEKNADVELLEKLGFGNCKLMIAYPENVVIDEITDLNGKTIATSYPRIVKTFLTQNNVSARIIEISGSVEIAPSLGVADIICDIVSTGNTLMINKLKKGLTVFNSQSVLIASRPSLSDNNKRPLIDDLLRRIRSVQIARSSKYLMMNIPRAKLSKIVSLLPALKSPTIVPLADESMVAAHAVIPSDDIWRVIDKLTNEGASGILLLPIDNMIP